MMMKAFLEKTLKLGIKLKRINAKKMMIENEYKSVESFANQYIDVPNVKEKKETLTSLYERYKHEIKCLMDEQLERENKKYAAYELMHMVKNAGIIAIILGFILYQLLNFVIKVDIFWKVGRYMQLVAVFVMVLGAVCWLIFKLCEVVCKEIYDVHFHKVKDQIDKINGRFGGEIKKIRKEIDDLYLLSLEPTHRELVLLRREQERQLQEQREYQKRMEMQQQEHQKALVEEQRKVRELQEELLKIERERENRRR